MDMDPFRPHHVPSSPQSISSSDGDETLFGLADSLPLFPDPASISETVPADPAQLMQQAKAAHLSIPEESSLQETGYSDLRCDPDGQQWLSEYSDVEINHVVSQQWLSAVVRSLTVRQLANLRLRDELRYGDDCSGARAPFEALIQVLTKLDLEAHADMRLCDKFASECPGTDGDGPRQFIEAQSKPDIMFGTVHRGAGALSSMDLYTGELQTVPGNLTIYTAGWVCRDVNPMNCHPKELLPGTHKKVVAGNAGASSQTLHSSLQYIETHRPDIALLENLVFKKNISIATGALKKMGGYSTIVFLIDSRTFGVPMSRRRMYVLAIRTHMLTAPLLELGSQLNDIANEIPSISTETLPSLLDEAPQSTSRTARHMKLPKWKSFWRQEHDKLRDALGLPSRRDIVGNVIAHSPLATSLPLRCQELLGLHWEVALRNGIDPGKYHFIRDLTNSAKFGCVKNPCLAGLVPCVLRGHILWDTKMGRQLTGAELLRVHGFCLQPPAAALDDGILRKLAGDTISVPPVGCILALALANINSLPRPFVQMNDDHFGPRWIGPSAWRGYNRSIDNLFKVAGLTPMPKRKSRCRTACFSLKRHNKSRMRKSRGRTACVSLKRHISLD